MKKNTKPAAGTRDFLPSSFRARRAAVARLARTFEAHGFAPLETPAFEPIERLTGLYGEEGEKLIFKILRRGAHGRAGAADLALRYDLTVPAARAVAEAGLAHGFRRYQIGPVWRAERAGRERFREFWQCDVDLYGVGAPMAEVETLTALTAGLRALGMGGIRIAVNTRPLLLRLCAHLGLAESDRRAVLTALDKLDRFGFASVREELRALAPSAEGAGAVRGLAEELGPDFAADLVSLPALAGSAEHEALMEVKSLAEIALGGAGAEAEARIEVSPLLVRGLDYYTGFIFEMYGAEGGGGAIAAGGRYDGLMEAVSGRPSPVCGGSLGLERILARLAAMDASPTESSPPVLHLALFGGAELGAVQALARDLRAVGLSVFTESGGRLEAQIKRAQTAGRRFLALYGADEIAAGRVAVKDLDSGAQTSFARDALEPLARHVLAGHERRGASA